MKTYLTIWPGGTHTIARAEHVTELFFILDEEGDPAEEGMATYELPDHWRSIVTEAYNPEDPTRNLVGVYLQDGNSPDLESLPLIDFAGEK